MKLINTSLIHILHWEYVDLNDDFYLYIRLDGSIYIFCENAQMMDFPKNKIYLKRYYLLIEKEKEFINKHFNKKTINLSDDKINKGRKIYL